MIRSCLLPAQASVLRVKIVSKTTDSGWRFSRQKLSQKVLLSYLEKDEEECGIWRAIFPPNIIAKSLLSNLEEDEEKGLDEAEHGAAHEHHDEKGDARDAAEDCPQALHRVRVLRQPDVLKKEKIFKGTVSRDGFGL